MASTYSTSLRLELMATGDQSGTWGDTTNTNLGSLLEQAITGVLSVAQGDVANFTPTSLNGALDQARNAVINLTGAMSANRNMVVPTANKLYLVKNSTTGGFSVTVKTAAGTGVAVLPGTSQWVYCDGTNVVVGLIGNGAPDANGNISANNFLAGYATTATAAGTTTLTVASAKSQYFTGATTQTVTLPVVSTLVLGQEYEIINKSSGAVTVNSSGGNLVATVAGGSALRVQVILITGTTAASWNAIAVDLSAYLPLAGGTMTGQLINTGSTVGYTPLSLISTEAAAAAGPIIDIYRNSASPSANDFLGGVYYNGKDSAGNKQLYADITAQIVSATSTVESGLLQFNTSVLGGYGARFSVASGMYSLSATGGDKGADTINVSTYYKNGVAFGLTSGTATATTSGISIDFTSLPAGVKRITISFAGISTNGTSVPIVQIGDSGGIENTGYLGATSAAGAAANYTTGMGLATAVGAGTILHGAATLTLLDASANTWSMTAILGSSNAAAAYSAGSSKSLSATLDRIRLTTVGGTDTFDAGSMNILYEI